MTASWFSASASARALMESASAMPLGEHRGTLGFTGRPCRGGFGLAHGAGRLGTGRRVESHVLRLG